MDDIFIDYGRDLEEIPDEIISEETLNNLVFSDYEDRTLIKNAVKDLHVLGDKFFESEIVKKW